ncbi:DJ-1/PfpI family protein [Saccharopolyspora taberi]|uniref:DJ-1/PfpI family protein n=1 Tax=Saccharopolyspora taberi TaxID=60895 RepID=A0ABN3VC16_9PSEU
MHIAFVLYPGMTALDLVGPSQVLCCHPAVEAHYVAGTPDPVRTDSGLVIQPTTTFAELTAPEVLVVPGGGGWRRALDDTALVDYIATAHPAATWTTSVCSGSTLLAKAGILTGKRATTHWAVRDVLVELGAELSTDRVVFDGNVVTAAGVSAGIDMGFALAAAIWDEPTAQQFQLGLEYDPQPPFDTGSPEKAPAEMVAAIRAAVRAA